MLNDPVFVEASQALADRVLREAEADTGDRIRHAFRLCLGREPKADELDADRRVPRPSARPVPSKGEIRVDGNDRTTLAGEAAERAAWIAVARALLNLDETITKE